MTRALGCCRWGAIWGSLTLSIFAGAIFSLTATEAHAQSDEGNLGLSFSAPEGCQDRDAFIARVQAYTSKARFTDDASGRLFAVSIAAASAEQLIGNLEIVSVNERATRTVTGKTCPELLDALALMTALAIDPQALNAPQPTPPPKQTEQPPKPQQKPLPRKPMAAAPEDSVQGSLGAEGWLLQGVLPKLAFGGAVLGELRTSTQATLRATFAAGAHYFSQADQEVRALRIAYAALGLQAQACAELGIDAHWMPALCLNGALGRLKTAADAVGSGSRTWAGVGIGPRLDWQPFNGWALRVEGNVASHLIENRVLLLAIEPNGDRTETEIHATQGLYTQAALGLLFHF
jgi:hypothetical protein